MFVIKDEGVIGGDKVCTPFGELIFKRVHETDDPKIADYFRNKTGWSVTEKSEESDEPEEGE